MDTSLTALRVLGCCLYLLAGTTFAKAASSETTSNADVCRNIEQDIISHQDPSKYCLEKTVLKDCCDSLIVRTINNTGIYWILNDHTKGLCDNDNPEARGGAGWLVMLRHDNHNNDKFREKTWKKYERGFGNFNRNFVLGLKTIHELTKQATMQLRVDLANAKGSYWAVYDDFAVDGPDANYKLRLGNYSKDSTLKDVFSQHNDYEFKTFDRNWDLSKSNPIGGWWISDYGGISFAPYSPWGIIWFNPEKLEFPFDLKHHYSRAEIRIRSKRYPCII